MVYGDRCVAWIVRGMLCGVYELWRGSGIPSLLCVDRTFGSVEAVPMIGGAKDANPSEDPAAH